MSDRERLLGEDRATRDAALALFKADLAMVRADLAAKGVGARIVSRIGEGAAETLDEVVDYAEDNKGKVAAALAALVLWFARGPIVDWIERLVGDEDDAEPGDAADRCDQD